MNKETMAKVLAEEIRTNVRLRREIGLTEGDESGVAYEDDNVSGIRVTTTEGQTFVLGVSELTDDDAA